MKSALKYFPNNTNTSKVHIKVFQNEMIMLHTGNKYIIILDEYSLESLNQKMKSYLQGDKNNLTLKEFSELTTNKNQLLSKILIDEMVDKGYLLLDESDLDVKFYLNKILNY